MSIPTDLFINSISTLKTFAEHATPHYTVRRANFSSPFSSQATIPFTDLSFFLSFPSFFHYTHCLLFILPLCVCVLSSLSFILLQVSCSLSLPFARFLASFSISLFLVAYRSNTLSCVPHNSVYHTHKTQLKRLFKFLSCAVAPATISADNSWKKYEISIWCLPSLTEPNMDDATRAQQCTQLRIVFALGHFVILLQTRERELRSAGSR